MRLSEFKTIISNSESINFQLENGLTIPEHFHITEVGINSKKFIDCGGTVREENTISFQLWHANDFEHKLNPSIVLDIINLAEKNLFLADFEIEIEYQESTIGKYDLKHNGNSFILKTKTTACLDEDNCGIPKEKLKVPLSEIQDISSSCSPGSGCC